MNNQVLTNTIDRNFDYLNPDIHAGRDHNFVLNTLHHLANESSISKTNFWTLTQYALNAIRSLQSDLNRAHKDLIEKNEKIEFLERLATTDSLTGLLNRRGFMDAMDKEIAMINREHVGSSLLIMIDLDNFKAINDIHGHEAGNEALKLVAQTLNAHIRKMDTAARMGGDEFVLIFSNAHPIETSARLQKLARKLNSLSMKWNDEHISIRASIGIHPFVKGDSMTTVLSKADANMYDAKRGKQQIAS